MGYGFWILCAYLALVCGALVLVPMMPGKWGDVLDRSKWKSFKDTYKF